MNKRISQTGSWFSRPVIGWLCLLIILLGILPAGADSVAPAQTLAAGAPPSSKDSQTAALPQTEPARVNLSAAQLAHIDEAVQTAIAARELPGAVVLVGRHGQIVWRKAYGQRAVLPAPEPMTVDTIFDLASLTKVVATATATMLLVERGKLHLRDPVAKYIPEFAPNGKAGITVEQLLTHRAGFIPDNVIDDYQAGVATAWQRLYALPPIYPPGTRFVYSDVGYIILGELVRRVSGQPLDEFAREQIFRPLGMTDTGFMPTSSLQSRVAPNEQREDSPGSANKHWMRGEVHDPRAFLLGGVAGHAGLFSTADDLARYCQMILNGGSYQGSRLLSPLTVARMTSPRDYGDSDLRGYGWDIVTRFSMNRGDLFPLGSFGHTGFTGTSMWLDPSTDTFVIFLSNRLHPDGKGDVASIRGRVNSIVASAILDAPAFAADQPLPKQTRASEPPALDSKVLLGIDVLERDKFTALAGRRVGLITNHTGRNSAGQSTIDLLFNAPNVKLVKLFSPEHGIRGELDEKVGDAVDQKTGLPILSLYSDTRRPKPEMLRDIDTLVFDIQDIGTRFYTYISTLGYAMEEAAKHKLKVVVLDRPNPINGVDVEGSLLDPDKLSFVGYYPLPIRHGMTVGELALLFNKENKINADLTVIKIEGWQRAQWFDATGLIWINPSPNMRSLTEATLYPGIGLLETTNLSVGRGTDTPFEIIGAPWLDGRKLAAALHARRIPGVRFVPVRFTPRASVFKGQECGGVQIIITNRTTFQPVATGIEIAAQLRRLYPDTWEIDKYERLLGNREVLNALKNNINPTGIVGAWQPALASFERVREKYLIY